MNLSQKSIAIKANTQLATAFLVDKVGEPSDENEGEHHNRVKEGACHSFGQVVANWEVDLSGGAVENEDQRTVLRELIERNADVFSQHSMDYGHTKTVQHEIPLVDSKPFRLPYRKIPPSQWQDVRHLLTEMEASGVIQPSKSLYA